MQKNKFILNFLVVLSMIAILIYVITRTILYFMADYNIIERAFSVMLIFGEFFVLMHGVGYAINIFKIITRRKEISDAARRSGNISGPEPSVAILVAARHEPREVLEGTFITIKSMDYKNKEIYFLDDSSDEKYLREAEEIAKDIGINLFRRKVRHGAKAGVVNDCLKTLTQKYVVIFDADQNPMPQFLKAIVPIMESDDKLAFVQTPQFYSNIETNPVARGSAFQQAVFYEYICEGKSSSDAMFCCGTNVIFRREALLAVGGLDESTVTEDFATSVKFHSAGWRSLYYEHACAFGMGPEDLGEYFKQQFRWATGTIGVFRKVLWRFLTHPFSLSFVQWWEYFLSSTYYFIGIAFFTLMICPVAYILFKVPSFFVNPEIYFLSFIPYFVLSISVFYVLLGSRRYRAGDLFLGQLLGLVTFPVYMRAAVFAMLGIKVSFGVTGKGKAKAIPYSHLWPQLAMIFICLVTVVWGVNRFIYEREAAILVNGFWLFYYFLTLSSIFYFNE